MLRRPWFVLAVLCLSQAGCAVANLSDALHGSGRQPERFDAGQSGAFPQELALQYEREGRDQQALAEYQRLVKERPRDSQLLNDFGVFHYDHGHWLDAESQFSKAIQCDPQNQRAWVNLGRALGQQERYQESYAAFARVLRPAEAHSNVAVMMAHHGKTEDARQQITEALTLDPQIQQARMVLATMDRPASSSPIGLSESLEPTR
jgi:Tfp pilus assembly protein PilF